MTPLFRWYPEPETGTTMYRFRGLWRTRLISGEVAGALFPRFSFSQKSVTA